MIARTWHGVTPVERADEYLRLMLTVAVPDYQAVPGNLGVYVLRRIEGDEAHFLLLTLWQSEGAIQAFAGADIEKAKYYDFDRDFLLELEPTVNHYDVFAAPVGDGTSGDYDPFARGRYPVGVRTLQLLDAARNRQFPCEIWYPAAAQHAGQDLAPASQDLFTEAPSNTPRSQMAIRDATTQPGTYPLVVFSHSSGGRRRQSTFLCTHLSSHGYVVAALDHSETIAPKLLRKEGETAEQRAARIQGWIANRVPDICFLLDSLLGGAAWNADVTLDPAQVGIVGHSFGGWTALATPEVDGRIGVIVALAPGGMSQPPAGIIPATLTFEWERNIPTLYLVAENDTALPLVGMYELFERTQATRRMVILRRADHEHFADEFEQRAEFSTPAQAHAFVRGLTLAHLDAVLRQLQAAQRFWSRDIQAELAARGVDAFLPQP